MQKYLAADKLYRSNIPSGEVEDDTKRHVVELYQKNNQVSTKDGPRDAPVFKSVSAALFLSKCPKFCAHVGGSSNSTLSRRASPPGDDDIQPASLVPVAVGGGADGGSVGGQPASGCVGAADEIVAVAVPANDPGASRPAGVKRQKLSASGQRKALPAVDAVAKSMIEVKAALEASTRRKSRIAGLALEAKLLEMLDDGLEKQRHV